MCRLLFGDEKSFEKEIPQEGCTSCGLVSLNSSSIGYFGEENRDD
jgi:hypothetical protein